MHNLFYALYLPQLDKANFYIVITTFQNIAMIFKW